MARATPSTKSPTLVPAPVAAATQQVTEDKIAKRAYEKWCQRGMRDGSAQQDWLDAEKELQAEVTKSAKTKK